jgi:hypothetical protein
MIHPRPQLDAYNVRNVNKILQLCVCGWISKKRREKMAKEIVMRVGAV